MVANIVFGVFSLFMSLVLFLLGLLPVVDFGAFGVIVPPQVSAALSALNWFVPMGTLSLILTVWIGLLLALNAFMYVASFALHFSSRA